MPEKPKPSRKDTRVAGHIQQIGLLEVNAGDSLPNVQLKAAKIALDQELTAVKFVHNGKPFQITYTEAREIYSPDNLKGEIDSLETEIQRHRKAIKVLRQEIKLDKKLGVKVYGEIFSTKTENKS